MQEYDQRSVLMYTLALLRPPPDSNKRTEAVERNLCVVLHQQGLTLLWPG